MKDTGEDRTGDFPFSSVTMGRRAFLTVLGRGMAVLGGLATGFAQTRQASQRLRTLVDAGWRFTKGDPPGNAISLLYDVRPQPAARGAAPAPLPPAPDTPVIKRWVLPTGNDFVKDAAKRAARPQENLGDGVAYIGPEFDDSAWRIVDVPHDYAIEGPFSATGGGGMGRLPSAGVVWGVGPTQKPNRYVAVTNVRQGGAVVDSYETRFGIRTLKFDPNAGFFLNGEHIKLNGVCNHHDLGALGSAINLRALQRQLEMLADMGCNALRTSHNPPAPELLDLADKMGFLVMDEAFDCWARQKTALDYHLLYADWHEQDLRALIRRDRNHPSVMLSSIGNELGEQTGGPAGAALAKELTDICHEEDPTRPTISGMNSATATGPFAAPIDSVGLNYQGAGLFRGMPQYPAFHQNFPEKFIVGSETAATLGSRGVYTFPVAPAPGAPASANAGQEVANRQVSSYDMYHASWAYTPDKEFAAQDRYPYVGGEFVWTGWDYLGEPTPFDASRSSYFGIIDLAGFKKDRFYLYQSYWRPNHPMAHILPHWTWPERAGQVTPVHVYTSGDEAELFLNGKSLGRKKKAEFEYRLRWDDVVYEPGELRVVAYKKGSMWASDSVRTGGDASQQRLTPDRPAVAADARDLSFVTLTVADKDGHLVPRSMNPIRFEITGPGEIVATDNGNPTDMDPFSSLQRTAFNGLALAIVRARRGQRGRIVVVAKSEGLREARATIDAR